MARVEVVQIKCERCKRVETVAPQPPKTEPDFRLEMIGPAPDHKKITITYDDTCESCKVALSNIVEQIKEWEREVKQPFGPTVPANVAPPLTPAPDYTPPKPHSLAAGKK